MDFHFPLVWVQQITRKLWNIKSNFVTYENEYRNLRVPISFLLFWLNGFGFDIREQVTRVKWLKCHCVHCPAYGTRYINTKSIESTCHWSRTDWERKVKAIVFCRIPRLKGGETRFVLECTRTLEHWMTLNVTTYNTRARCECVRILSQTTIYAKYGVHLKSLIPVRINKFY